MADYYTELEKAVVVLVENFYKSVSRWGWDKNNLSTSRFRRMLQSDLSNMLTDIEYRKAADKFIQYVDCNHDRRISFDEYWHIIGEITTIRAQVQE